MSAPWSFLREFPRFRRLWLATTLSELGSSVARIAFILLVHQRAVARGGAPESANALMLILETLPMVLLGPVAGALVDRCDRRTLLVGASCLQAMLLASVPLAARLDAVWPLYALAMLVAAISTVFAPARQSAIPDLVGVGRSATANSISSSTTSLMFIAGAALAGLTLDRFGKDGCFWLAAASLAFAALWLVPLALPRHSSADGAVQRAGVFALFGEIADGLRYVRTQPTLVYITSCFVMAFVFIGIWFPLVPEYLRRDLGVDADLWMPRSWMAFGLGGIAGGACGAAIGRKFGLGRTIVLIYFVEPLQVMAYYFVHSAPVMLVLSFTWGVIAFAYFVQEQTVLHEDVPAELRGRVFGMMPPLQALGTLVANGIVLAEAGALAPRTLLLISGASYLAMSLLFTTQMRGARLLWRRAPPVQHAAAR
jgi:predicted MFS family arabinose efflux permease